MMPQGMFANSCSAFWHNSIFSFCVRFLLSGHNCSKNMHVATSSEAELDSPPPSGTDVAIAALNDGVLKPKLAMTPFT